jgi:hypothetical protein
MDWGRLFFLALWLLPAFAFSSFVHIQDPGQALAMAPPIALLGGYVFNRALDQMDAAVSRWQTITLVLASMCVGWLIEFRNRADVVLWLPLVALAAGFLLKFDRVANKSYLPRVAAMAFLLAPVVILNFDMFRFEGWYYQGRSTAGPAAAWEQVLSDINSGLALTSIGHIRSTLAVDDHSLREAIRLAAERPEKTVVVWEHGLVAWRKAAYYVPAVPILVLEHQTIRSGSLPVIAVWKGSRLMRRMQGPPPLRAMLPEGGRVVWLLNPQTEFYTLAGRSFQLTPVGPIYYTDLPDTTGVRSLGEYELAW